jgi:hypothetical protein
MKMNEIKMKAKALGIKVMATTRKADLIRKIQRAEGNFDWLWHGHRVLRSMGLLLSKGLFAFSY